ncbi:MAG: hypothetical protein KDK33_18625 [Leptospiraceae bacterium]|nr:hypothetical protein [Leptospiraceae bacterium]
MLAFKKNRILWAGTATVALGILISLTIHRRSNMEPAAAIIDARTESKIANAPALKVQVYYRHVTVDPYKNQWRDHPPPPEEFLPATPYDLLQFCFGTPFR